MNHKLQQVTNAPSKARCKKQFWLSISFGLLICLLVCFFTIPTLQGTGATVLKVGPCIPPPSGMVAWWPLDETSGTTAHDIAGYPNNGTWINNPTPVPGMVSGALSFNGNNSVEVVDHSELNFGKDDFSIDVWVKVKETGSSSVQTILDKRIASQPNQIGYELYLYGGKPGIQLADGTFTNYNSTTSIADGNWHFIAVTVERNNSSGLLFYVDGGLVSTFNPTAHAGNLTNAAPFVIARNLITSSQVFTGTLDEIELFKRVLSAVEIKSIYSAGSAGKCKGTAQIHVCKFNDSNGNGVQDTGELLIPNWPFNVTGLGGPYSASTGTNGCFDLIVPAPGTYTVTEIVDLTQWTPTTPNPQTVTVQPNTGVIFTFGNHKGSLTGQICVKKFNDVNGNGVQDTGEPLMSGWVFNVTGPNNFTCTITSQVTGQACCVVPAPGTYTVTEVVQSGWTVTTNNNPSTVIVQPGQQMSLTFGNRQQCTCLPPPEEGMVGWWPLDETSGPTSFDIAGYPNNGTWINNPTPASGKVAGALYFVGNHYVEVPPQAELDFGTGDFSIDAWVRPVDCSHGVGGVLSPIVDKFNGTTGFSLYLDQPTVGVAYLKLNINGSTFMSSGTIPTLGSVTWSHIAVTIHRGAVGTVGTFYINGSQAGSFTPPTGTVTNNLPLWIGEIRVPGGRCEIAIDELELFNRALSPDEIKGIYNTGSCGKCKPTTGQICVEKFNDLNGNSVQDTGEPLMSGWIFNVTGPNNFTCTITSQVTDQACCKVPAPGTYTVTEVVQPGWTVTTQNPQTVTVQPGQTANLTFGNSQCTCVQPPSGMVAWYPLDELAGAVAVNDIAPQPDSMVNNMGTPKPGGSLGTPNGPQPVIGKVNGAMYFDNQHYVEVAPQAELDFGTGSFSIDAWVRVVQCTRFSGVVYKFDMNTNTGFSFYLEQSPAGTAFLKLQINSSTFTSTGSLTADAHPLQGTGTWYHIAVAVQRVVNGTMVGTFYINGFPAGTFIPPTGSVNNTQKMLIGNYVSPVASCEIAIDELELFNRVLSPDEIKGIHNAGSCGKCKPVTAQICVTKFNDLDGNGKPDQNEPLLSSWVFNVTDQNGNLVGTITTNPVSASSCLTVPAPGTYTVTEVVQPGWTVTTPNPQTVTVQPGQTANLNFGNIEKGKCDLLIEKTVSPNPVASGGTVTITLTVKNVGTSACGPIPGIIVADPWPVGLTNSSSVVVNVVNNPAPSAGPWTTGFSGGEIWGTNPTPLPPGYEVTFTFTATVTASPGSMIQNCSEVSNVGDADQTNNHSCVTIQVTRYIKPTIIILQIGKSNFTVNGISNTLDSPPIIKNNRTLLPIRAIVEALGGSVSWDATERKVTVSLGSTTIELWIGKSIAKVNGIDTPIDSTNPKVVPEIINSRTMLPIRFIAETLGCDVQWDGTMKTITITYQP